MPLQNHDMKWKQKQDNSYQKTLANVLSERGPKIQSNIAIVRAENPPCSSVKLARDQISILKKYC